MDFDLIIVIAIIAIAIVLALGLKVLIFFLAKKGVEKVAKKSKGTHHS